VVATAAGCATILVALGLSALLPRRASRLGLAGLIGLCPLLAFYTQTGMETVFFAALVFGATTLVVREQWREPVLSRLVLASLVFGVSALTRPEGVLLFGLVFLACVAAQLRARSVVRWDVLVALAVPFSLLWGSYFAWRLATYGFLFPNTFYAKHSGSRLLNLPLGIVYFFRAWPAYMAVPSAVFAVTWLLGDRGPVTWSPRRAWAGWLALICVIFVAYVVWVGGDDRAAFPSVRLFIPVLPLMWLAMAMALEERLERTSNRGAVVALLCGAAMASWGSDAVELIKLVVPRTESPATLLRSRAHAFTAEPPSGLAEWIRQRTRADEYIAVPWAGAIPYYSDRPTIDMLGLNDLHIAHQPARQRGIDVKMDPAYVLARRPRLIFVNVGRCYWEGRCSFEEAGGWKWGDRELLDLLRRSPEYQWVADAPTDVLVFQRRD
jgi:hypothetical protein